VRAKQFATTTRRTIATRGAYIRANSKEVLNSKYKLNKRRIQQEMASNLQGKKVQTSQDDEVRYIFIPI
jgi:TRAP-type mannitol/chloroaromatic compound transport system substrate-binding protein